MARTYPAEFRRKVLDLVEVRALPCFHDCFKRRRILQLAE